MQNITSACLEALYNDAVQSIQIHVAPLRGSEFDITENDIVQGGFSYDSYTHDSGMLQIGTMTAAEVNLTLENTDGRFNGIWFAGAILTVKLRILLENGQYEVIPFGVYTVDEQPRSGVEIDIAALDNMVRLDVPFDATVFPTSLVSEQDIVQAAMRACGLQCNDYSMFRNTVDIQLDEVQSESTVTWRQVVMWCCQMNCVNGFADENGYICFKFYEKYVPKPLQTEAEESLETEYGDLLLADEIAENDFPITAAERYMDGSTYDEGDCVITGCQFSDGKDDGAAYPADADMEYGIQITGNLLWSAALQKQQRATLVNDKLKGFTYFPYQCNITPFPHLQLMDGIDYVRNGTHHHSVITHLQFTLNGGMSIAAAAQSKTQKGYASLGALTPGQQAIIDSISKNVFTTHSQLSDYENALLLFNERMFNAMGLYKTIENPDGGGMLIYFHDKPTLEESATIYMFGTSGFAWTVDGWSDGNPVWNYGFTNNGETILNTIQAYIISAELIKTGKLQSQNGASWIDMDDGTFCFGSDAGTALALDASKTLNIYGVLKSLQYPDVSVSIGKSINGNYGAFTVTDNAGDWGDIFQVYRVVQGSTNYKGVVWTSPCITDTSGATELRKGITVLPNEISIFNDDQFGRAILGGGTGGAAWISTYRDQINISTKPSDHSHVWFNFYAPSVGKRPTGYEFGNGTEGGWADIVCAKVDCSSLDCSGRIDCGGDFIGKNTWVEQLIGDNVFFDSVWVGGTETWPDCILNVSGNAFAANWYLSSDPALKSNIEEQSPNALEKLQGLKFYSYDINLSGDSNAGASVHSVGSKSEQTTKKAMTAQTAADSVETPEMPTAQTHVKLGIMATESPDEITTDDGKGISLYSYISLCAKAIQELSEKCDAQEQRIAELEERIAVLES